MTYVFDIDGTICHKLPNQDYEHSKPFVERIKIINNLYDNNNIIIFHTARGMGRFKNDCEESKKAFYDLTVKQLHSWGVKYHQLFLGKPSGDIYVDDKGIRDEDFFEQ
jgi:hypothetical protein